MNTPIDESTKALSFIIEDDEDLSAIFHEALNAAGFKTEIIQNGRLAIDRLREATPNVVILDMHLPLVTGIDILKHIRAQKHLTHTSVIVTTADALMGEQVRDVADFVLIKPISFSQLRDLTIRLNPDNLEG